MPYKCASCSTIVQKLENAECECENPFFIECALVHYIHQEGPGKVVSKSYNNQGASIDDEGFSKPITIRNLQELRLGCNFKKPIHLSIMSSLVSCPDCLAFIEKLKSRSTECQLSEDRTMASTMASTSVTPKSDSVNHTVTMGETLTSMQSDKLQ